MTWIKKYGWIPFIFIMVGIAIFAGYHNWNSTTPERLVDPLNWILLFVFTGLSFIARKL